MKQLGLLRFTAEGDVAQLGQPRLVAGLGAGFFQTVQAARAAETLIAIPPKHFIVNGGGGVEFGPQPAPIETTSDLIGATWRVRNKLFHGNKLFPANRERDEGLMTDALAVLEMIVQALPDVSMAFREPQQYFLSRRRQDAHGRITRLSSKELLALHAKIADELRARGVTRTANNPTGDLAEHLFCTAFGWVRAGNSHPNVDAIGSDGLRFEIKGRRLTKNRSRQLGAIRALDGEHFDFLATFSLTKHTACCAQRSFHTRR